MGDSGGKQSVLGELLIPQKRVSDDRGKFIKDIFEIWEIFLGSGENFLV